MPDLNIVIGTDATAFNRGMASAAQTAQTTANSINSSAARIGSSVSLGANQAGQALTNLGRVAQDSPYGFIGISNNLNPLLESFQRLRTEAGSNGAALRSLGSSLLGPAGIGIALSVATAAITFFQVGLSRWIPSLKEGKKSLDDISTATSATSKALTDTDYTKAVTNVNELRENINLAKDGFISKEAVVKQYNETIGKTTGFVNNLSEAENSLNKNADAYIKYTLLKASAQIALQAAAKKAAEAQQVDFKTDDQSTDFIDKYITPILSGNVGGIAASQNASEQVRQIAKANRAKEKADLTKDSNDMLSIFKNFQDQAAKIAKENGFKFFDDKGAPKAKTLLEQLEAQLKSLQDAEAQYVSSGGKQDFFHLTDRERDINALIDKIAKLKEATNGLDIPTVKGTNAVTVSNPASGTTGTDSETIKGMQDYVKHTREIQNQIGANEYNNKVLSKQEKIGRQLISTFGGGLTDAFQSALNGTQSFVSAMGQFLLQLITKLVAAALAAVALAVILSAVGFGPGIGGAASQIGSFKNIFGSLSGIALADGGITQGPTRALIGEGREQEAVIPLSKLGQFVNSNGAGMADGKIVGVMRGSDLLLQYRRAEKSNQRRG